MTKKNGATRALSADYGPPEIQPKRHVAISRDGRTMVFRAWAVTEVLQNGRDEPRFISATQIESLLASEGLPSTPTTVKELGFYLNIMRVTVHAQDAISVDPAAATIEAMQRLKELLPILINAGTLAEAKAMKRNDLRGASGHAKRRRALTSLNASIERASDLMIMPEPGKRGGALWHDDAILLASILRSAGESVGQPVAFSNDGPGSRFLQKILREACSLTVSLDAIKNAVARHASGPVLIREFVE